MKTNEEIKKFIDSKTVLTKSELCIFFYGEDRHSGLTPRLQKWWDYVLETKNLVALKLYREQKIRNFPNENFFKFRDLYLKDKRFQIFGTRKLQRLLKEVYNLNFTRNTIHSYKKECLQKTN